MNIGLPGAGIGGLYYLGCAVIMPVKELFLTVTKPEHKFRYKLVATQLGIAIGIMAGFFLIYYSISQLLGLGALPVAQVGEEASFYPLLPVIVSFSLLIIILVLVELAAFVTKKQKQPAEEG